VRKGVRATRRNYKEEQSSDRISGTGKSGWSRNWGTSLKLGRESAEAFFFGVRGEVAG